MDRKILVICQSFIAGLAALPSFADGKDGSEKFTSLCVQGGYIPLSGKPPVSFPDAVPLNPEDMLADIPSEIPLEVIEAWLLEPHIPIFDQAALVAARFEHPSLGEMAACMILVTYAATKDLQTSLIDAGAELKGAVYFIEGNKRAWMISAKGWPENATGEGLILGLTPNGRIPD